MPTCLHLVVGVANNHEVSNGVAINNPVNVPQLHERGFLPFAYLSLEGMLVVSSSRDNRNVFLYKLVNPGKEDARRVFYPSLLCVSNNKDSGHFQTVLKEPNNLGFNCLQFFAMGTSKVLHVILVLGV